MIVAALTATGIGSRMGQNIPKQFMHTENKPVIIHTVEALQNHPSADVIAIATLPAWIDVPKAYAAQFNIIKLRWVVTGGNMGQESTCNALDKARKDLQDDGTIIMAHDGNRCMVSNEVTSDSLATFKEHGSAVAAIFCVEAIFRSEDKGVSSVIPTPRGQLFRIQTSHTYILGKLLWAYNEAKKRNTSGSAASCTLMQGLGKTVYFSKGSGKNLKITTVDDMVIFKALLHTKKDSWLRWQIIQTHIGGTCRKSLTLLLIGRNFAKKKL